VTESGLETIPLFDDAFLPAVPASDPRPEKARVTTEDIDPVQLHCLRDQALALCASAHGNPEICLGLPVSPP
jgi:LysR family hydrogen peroxide-inducible transcriptional activator